jgi:peroxiredoxin
MIRALTRLALLTLLAWPAVAAPLPRKAPEVIIQTADGKKTALSSLKGKVVCLMFFLTTCPHCQDTTRVLTGLQQEYGARGFQVFAGAMDQEGLLAVKNFIPRFRPNFIVGVADQQAALTFAGYGPFERVFVPFLFFLDRTGTIRAQYQGSDDFFKNNQQTANARAMIEKLLNEGAAAAKPTPKAAAQK